MKAAAIVIGVVIVSLGALWLLQGLGAVTMRPVLCFANCTPIEGPVLSWAITGLVTLIVGVFTLRFGLKK